METNEILDEIRRVREQHARECGYDVDMIFTRMRENLERLKAEGWQIVAPAPRAPEPAGLLRDEPPQAGNP